MSIRLMCCSVLVVGASLLGMACGPAVEAQEQSQEQRVGGEFCGGIAGIPCSEGFTCVDDPNDDCDPNQGGADCGGICRQDTKSAACAGREPGQRYVSRDPAQCAAILFTCKEGFTPFFNDCGCGCQRDKLSCDYDDPNRAYISQAPSTCAVIRFTCAEGLTPFFDDCGCGCERTP